MAAVSAMVLVSGAFAVGESKNDNTTTIQVKSRTNADAIVITAVYSIPKTEYKNVMTNDANGTTINTSWGLMETGYTKTGMYYEYLEMNPAKFDCKNTRSKNLYENICMTKGKTK